MGSSRVAALCAVAVTLACSPAGAAWGQACLGASKDWQNTAFAWQAREFEAVFDAAPSAPSMDGIIGLSPAEAASQAGLAAAVRFNPQGFIDALGPGGFGAQKRVEYDAGTPYHFRVHVNPATKRYTVRVAPPGGAETAVVEDYAFNPWQGAAQGLGTLTLHADSGSHQICGFAVAASRTDKVPPTVSIASPYSGALVSGLATVTGSASDNVAVAAVQVTVDRDPPVPAAGTTAWTYALNAAGLSNGPHTVTVEAEDSAGNKGTAHIVVIVQH